MRRLAMFVSVVALVAVLGCTPTTAPVSTLASTSTVPAQGLREVIVPANLAVDAEFYPAWATVSAISFATCSRLGYYDVESRSDVALSEWSCEPAPSGLAESPPVQIRGGVTQYGGFRATSPDVCIGGSCFLERENPVLLRIRW